MPPLMMQSLVFLRSAVRAGAVGWNFAEQCNLPGLEAGDDCVQASAEDAQHGVPSQRRACRGSRPELR